MCWLNAPSKLNPTLNSVLPDVTKLGPSPDPLSLCSAALFGGVGGRGVTFHKQQIAFLCRVILFAARTAPVFPT